MDSFPQLAGTVHSFMGKELDARKLSEKIHAGEPWGAEMSITGVTLNPAACYPVYPSFAGTVPKDGRLVTMFNWVYRHEPSPEPTRMQAFRVREFVRVGTPDQVVQWRDMWLQRGLGLLESLGLPAQSDVASDPFFGKGGKMLAASQREQKLKFEVLVPVVSKDKPTACCSFNFHEAHFGEVFGIQTQDGNVANTACLGFGLERCVMALFQQHGFDPGAWPSAVRAVLWPS
jgi:seryl-tRNA synthetase